MKTPDIWGWTDIGKEHALNDDSVFPLGQWPNPVTVPRTKIVQRGYLVAIADGVSHSTLGALASQTALQTLVDRYYGIESADFDIAQSLLAAAYAANDAVLALTEHDENQSAMTTLVALVMHDKRAWVVHAGDSRAYRISAEGVQALTTDHSIVQELFDAQVITAHEAINHPQKGVLTRALGVNAFLIIEASHPIQVNAHDRLLLCSDGLSALVTEEEMADIVLHEPPAQAVHTLIDLANHRGGYDNISVVVAGSALPKRAYAYRFRKLLRLF